MVQPVKIFAMVVDTHATVMIVTILTVCKHIDECLDGSHICDREQGTCHNDVGTYTCTCDGAGWRLIGYDHTCDDIDECAESSDNCVNADFTDTDCSFKYTCLAGYDGAPSCTGINE